MSIKLICCVYLSSLPLINLSQADCDRLIQDASANQNVSKLEGGKTHILSIFVPRNEKCALQLFLTAGEEGDPLGYFYAAGLLENGAVCIESNQEESIILYGKAEEGLSAREESELNGEQLYALGRIYEWGLGGIAVNPEKARILLENSCKLNYAPAMWQLGMQLLTLLDGPSTELGVKLICDSARAGELVPILMLPVLSQMTGINDEQRRVAEISRIALIKDFSEEAEGGDAAAMHRLGYLFVVEGKSVLEGIELLAKASKLGSVEALVLLGNVYSEGRYGVERNIGLARNYWSQAANLGDCRAIILLDSIDK